MKSSKKTGFLLVVALAGVAIGLWAVRKSALVAEPTAKPAGKATAMVTRATSPNQPTSTSNPPNSAQIPEKFSEMNVLERNAFQMEMRKQSLASILLVWLEAGRVEKDLMKQEAMQTTLVYAIRENSPNPEFLKQIEDFIKEDSNSVSEREQLIFVLAGAATKESVEILLRVASTLPNQELKKFASDAVRTSVGGLRGDGIFHEELSPLLERTWRESQDQNLLISVAVAMTKVGAASSVSLLLDAALAAPGQDDVRGRAAQGALASTTILNPNAVRSLEELLMAESPGSVASQFSADTLARSGIPAAAEVLSQWLRTANESVAPQAQRYAAHARTPALLKVFESILDPTVPFRSEKNREAIRAGLAEYRQARKFESVR